MVESTTLGKKRQCPSCLAKFYDLGKNPATCPKCMLRFDTNVILRRRKIERKTDDTGEDLLVAAANKAKASMLRKSKVVDEDIELEDVEVIGGGVAEIEEVDDLDEMEVLEEIDSDEEESDDTVLEEKAIVGEKIVDDFEEDEEYEEEEEEDDGKSSKSSKKTKPAKPVKGTKKAAPAKPVPKKPAAKAALKPVAKATSKPAAKSKNAAISGKKKR